ncbi:MAG: ABC transporter permease [Bacteroidaceae bacterium]
MNTFLYLLRKEFIQIRRNSFMRRMIIMYPLVITLVFPWATTMDLIDCGVVIVDHDHSQLSSRLVNEIDALPLFHVTSTTDSYELGMKDISSQEATAIMEIPHGFSDSVRISSSPIYIASNAIDGLQGSLAMNYLGQVTAQFGQEINHEIGLNATSNQSQVSIKYMFNDTLNYQHFMIPGLVVFALIALTAMLPALNIVSEKEKGTIEQINVTPIHKYQFILAKLIPYWLIGLLAVTICVVLAGAIYGYLPKGSYASLYLLVFLFILTMSAIGLMLSNKSNTMQEAVFVMFFLMMIFTLMSGLFTPVQSMDSWARWIADINPPRYFVDGMRAIYIKGSSFAQLSTEYLALTISSVLFGVLAVYTYKKQN